MEVTVNMRNCLWSIEYFKYHHECRHTYPRTRQMIHAMLTAVISPCQVPEIEALEALGEEYVLIMSARIKI